MTVIGKGCPYDLAIRVRLYRVGRSRFADHRVALEKTAFFLGGAARYLHLNENDLQYLNNWALAPSRCGRLPQPQPPSDTRRQ